VFGLVFVVAFVVGLSGRAGAGPFYVLGTNRPSPFGGLYPFEPARVHLVSEEVVIRAEGDGTHYQVEARYRLDRLAEATKVSFGVPINGTGDDALARTVRIAADGGREIGCERARPGTTGGGPLSPPAWCAATLALGPGLHALVLRYRGELVYEDGDFAGGPHVTARHLVYPLSTAGYWTGLPGRVSVKVDLTRLPGAAVTAKPTPAKTSPRLLAWSFVPRGEAARQVRELDVVLSLRWQFRRDDFSDGRPQRLEAAVRASSVLEPAAEHVPRNVTDANPLTAWCADPARGTGGSWIELRLPPDANDRQLCGIVSVSVLPGQGALTGYRAERRPSKLGLSACGDDRPIVEARVSRTAAPGSDPNTAMEVLALPTGAQVLSDCVRITLAPTAGSPACISEILPFFSCAMPQR